MFNEDGFTLIEMLVTLMIVTALLLLPTSLSKGLKSEMDTQYFLNSFESAMSEQQLYSIVANQETKLNLTLTDMDILGGFSESDVRSIDYPDGLTSTRANFIFSAGSGNVGGNKTIKVTSNKTIVEVVVQVMFGRYYIKQHEK